MTIVIKLDEILLKRKKKSRELADYIGITEANISLFKNGKIKGLRFSTLDRMCEFLDCEPGDLLFHEPSKK